MTTSTTQQDGGEMNGTRVIPTWKRPLQPQPRLGIVIPLEELRKAMHDYLDERGGKDDLLPRLLLSDFLEWIRRKR